MSKAFTLIELLVVLAIITVLTAITVPNYRGGDKQLALQRSASKLAQDLRRAQEMSMSAKEVSGAIPYGFGIYFNSASPNNYIIFADLDNSHHRNAGDADLETIALELNIRISALSPVSSFSILFAPPDPTVWINRLSSGVTAAITLGIIGDAISNQIISANNAGLIAIE
ncbi:MAG: prepilin-type N-terminal cleavage/methylation domain-containing protein [Candidatus Nealsonbacteria bacterium]|nr:prepilin-type N-terminal cleavage/methylation domain-containing protein [Candidatus Nealsonbacteria bacterium]